MKRDDFARKSIIHKMHTVTERKHSVLQRNKVSCTTVARNDNFEQLGKTEIKNLKGK